VNAAGIRGGQHDASSHPSWLSGPFRLARWLLTMLLGTLLCLTPVGAIVALGWQLRAMRRAAAETALRRAGMNHVAARVAADAGSIAQPGLVMGQGRGLVRLVGGLAANLRSGLAALVPVAAYAGLPGGGLALAWYAGWQNSFAKGYENAAIGPALFLPLMLVAALALAHLPLALAHMAVERRIGAAFELRRLRALAAASGWRYLVVSAGFVLLAFPWLLLRVLPVFAHGFDPAIAAGDVAAAKEFEGALAAAMAAGLFTATTWARLATARAYGRAMARLAEAGHPAASGVALAPLPPPAGRKAFAARPLRWVAVLLLTAIWLLVPAVMVVAQFMNMDWLVWVLPPLAGLPWSP
jgi:hypothetical protein